MPLRIALVRLLGACAVAIVLPCGCAREGLPSPGESVDLAAAPGMIDLGTIDLRSPLDLARSHRLSFAPAVVAWGHFTGMPGTGYIGAVATADFTGDGKVDLLRAWIAPGRDILVQLVVQAGKGDGTINYTDLVTPTSCADMPRNIVVADFNGDGKPDVFAGDCGAQAGVFHGKGDGTFKAPVLSASLLSPVVSDFDGDGKLDIAGFSAVGVVRVARPQPDGSLAPVTDVTVGGRPQALVAADVNGDHFADLVVTTPAAGGMPDQIQVLLGRANGQMLALPAAGAGTLASCAVAGDLDRDGRADLALRDAVLPGRGDGTFGAARAFREPGYCPSGLADFDGDGALDLSVGPEINAQGIDLARGYVRLGHGDGSFDPVVGLDAPPVFQVHRFGAPRVTDWNGDGKPDLFGFFAAFESDGVITAINTSN